MTLMDDVTQANVCSTQTRTLLDRVASALGVSSEVFFSAEAVDPEKLAIQELLQLWQSIDSKVDRRKLLGFARLLSSGENAM
jgi:hypothetical protein